MRKLTFTWWLIIGITVLAMAAAAFLLLTPPPLSGKSTRILSANLLFASSR